MNPQKRIFLVRGFPGSGRSEAIAALLGEHEGLATVSAQPEGVGDDFEDRDAQFNALKRAHLEIERLVADQVPQIAVETCAPRRAEVTELLSAAVAAGYEVTSVRPAGAEPENVLFCYPRSSHEPSPVFYERLAAAWEPYTPPGPQAEAAALEAAGQVQAVWREYLAILRSRENVAEKVAALVERAPVAALALGLDDGFAVIQPGAPASKPVFPLAGISPYWKRIEAESLGQQHAEAAQPEPVEAVDYLTEQIDLTR